MVDPKKSDTILEDMIKAYRIGLESKEPGMLLDMVMKAQRSKKPGDPFNTTIAQFIAYVMETPDLIQSTDFRHYANKYIQIFAQKIKTTLAKRLGKAYLNDEKHLTIDVENDWRINAVVESEAPYNLYISSNLILFCAKLSELLISGMGLDVTDENSKNAGAKIIKPHYALDEISLNVRSVLDAFIKDQTIPVTPFPMAPSHTVLHQIVLLTIMAFIISHEFGHVTINEYRIDRKPPPFSDFAEDLLKSNFDRLIHSGRHDPEDSVGLRKLNEKALRQVFANWVNEINADIIGASLAAEYQQEIGPWKNTPGIPTYTYMSIHLSFIAQMYLYNYQRYLKPSFPITSKTHPPIDFRMYCVLHWMYKGDWDVTKPLTDYSHEIMMKVLAFGV